MRFLVFLGSSILLTGILGMIGLLFGFWFFGRDLPDYSALADYKPAVMSRVHAGDGSLLSEFAKERRIFIPIEVVPQLVIDAFLSAEDKTFFSHHGIDFIGIAGAALHNFRNIGKNRRPVGASTITQQVAKNFLLSNEVSITRKAREAMLALRIERALSKNRILELYLNQIYLGLGSYGIAAAALSYFDKSLEELSLAEAAYLAALPKAPNNYHPTRRKQAAIRRRNWVLSQMLANGVIDEAQMGRAKEADLVIRGTAKLRVFKAEYFVEEVRRELLQVYGEKGLYEGGLSVRTTLEPSLQILAEQALAKGLLAYDRRHGWRGPLAKLDPRGLWQRELEDLEVAPGARSWKLAVTLEVSQSRARIGLFDGTEATIPFAQLNWARQWRKKQKVGPRVTSSRQVLKAGDVIYVEAMEPEEKDYGVGRYHLRQTPDVNGAIIAMDPHTGRVLAMVGGFSFATSEFNRATQALRQPGSAFKPIVYAAALENGYSPSSLILDAPFVLDQGPLLGRWKPTNYTKKFYGPSTLRLGLEKSRNLMTVRLAQYMGMQKVVDYARRMGVIDDMPAFLPMALGAGETTLLRMTAAYGIIVNGGMKVTPRFVDRVQDRRGATVFKHDKRACPGCLSETWNGQRPPRLADIRERVLQPQTAYQLVSMLQGVVQRGTGARIASLGKPLAGKTGTTNQSRDAWFIGFSPDLVVGVYVGFDSPRSLGRKEQGASVALPVFKDFFAHFLDGKPAKPFRVPSGIKLVRIDRVTGQPSRSRGKGTIWEAYKANEKPNRAEDAPAAFRGKGARKRKLRRGSGGLY